MAPTGLQSMTGFSRADGAGEGCRWTWELRSVNAKGLDVRFRGPAGADLVEPAVRERAAARFARGAIQATLTLQREGSAAEVRINQPMLDQLIAAVESIRRRVEAPPPAIETLLGIRGVLEVTEAEPGDFTGALGEAVLATLDTALGALATARGGEGGAIGAILSARLDRIAALTDAAEATPGRSPDAIRVRLAEQVAALLGAAPALDPDRLYQEAALLATRVDIREELDRLHAHVAAARELLAAGGPVGRRLDFLAQEFNRESNTLCAKSNDRALTAIGLDLKAVVDQLREQIQNLE